MKSCLQLRNSALVIGITISFSDHVIQLLFIILMYQIIITNLFDFTLLNSIYFIYYIFSFHIVVIDLFISTLSCSIVLSSLLHLYVFYLTNLMGQVGSFFVHG